MIYGVSRCYRVFESAMNVCEYLSLVRSSGSKILEKTRNRLDFSPRLKKFTTIREVLSKPFSQA